LKSYKFIISGKVQGVYYRVSVKNNAISLNYHGYVRNMPDGTVEACVTCHESEVDNFINILKKGSRNSHVTAIKQLECKSNFTKLFKVQ